MEEFLWFSLIIAQQKHCSVNLEAYEDNGAYVTLQLPAAGADFEKRI